MTEPQWKHGKVCYIILASKEPQASAKFYSEVFGWTTRGHDNGDLAFDDTTGGVSGMWDTSITPREGGYEVDIWVDDVAATSAAIESAGGTLLSDIMNFSDHEQYRRFSDVDGNVLGIYHHDES